MSDQPRFLFVTCQVGAERAVKGELARRWPDCHRAFSRPGFLTFKLPEGTSLPADFDLESVFARAYGFCLGKVVGASEDTLARKVWQLYGERPVQKVHVWERDQAEPGDHDFEPSITPAARAAFEAVRRAAPGSVGQIPSPPKPGRLAASPAQETQRGDWVLDCVLVDPGQWWVGFHRARSVSSQWPGGMLPLGLPAEAVSRAWLKMEEALWWSQLPIPAGARCAELGSAPGGASQALLARGVYVLGIDPAEMHPEVLKHPHFRHLRRRVPQVPRREFRKIRWLTADMNVAPSYTLDAVEAIVTHPEVSIRGMILTLKLTQWGLAAHMPEYLDRVHGWGYNIVAARQLQHNHREFCIAALQKPFRRKPFK
jgi:23S rRNA (cytidine2498-2'-O)-methyltransferase